MKKTVLIIALILVIASWYGCQYKKEAIEFASTNTTCDTSNVRYSVEVTSILQANCYSCHSSANASSAGGSINLEGYNNIKTYAQFGLLLNAITRTNNTMPKGAARLSDCNIGKIRTWIRNGYLNN